jgi:hypothetical protein
MEIFFLEQRVAEAQTELSRPKKRAQRREARALVQSTKPTRNAIIVRPVARTRTPFENPAGEWSLSPRLPSPEYRTCSQSPLSAPGLT